MIILISARGEDGHRMHELIYDVVSMRAKKRCLNHALMLVDARRGLQDVDVELLQLMERALGSTGENSIGYSEDGDDEYRWV